MIQLEREWLVRLYVFCRQAERSVHRALQAEWSDFRDYYTTDKRSSLQALVRRLGSELPHAADATPAPTRAEVGRAAPRPGLVGLWFRKWKGRRQRAWPFPEPDVRFLVSTLRTLLRLLDDAARPVNTALIDLRMDLCTCGGLVEARCPGLDEIERARRVEHFDQTDWVPHVRLAELFPEEKPGGEVGAHPG